MWKIASAIAALALASSTFATPADAGNYCPIQRPHVRHVVPPPPCVRPAPRPRVVVRPAPCNPCAPAAVAPPRNPCGVSPCGPAATPRPGYATLLPGGRCAMHGDKEGVIGYEWWDGQCHLMPPQ